MALPIGNIAWEIILYLLDVELSLLQITTSDTVKAHLRFPLMKFICQLSRTEVNNPINILFTLSKSTMNQ